MFVAVFGKQQGYKLGVYGFETAEFSPQVLGDEAAVVPLVEHGEVDEAVFVALPGEVPGEEFNLGGFAGAVEAFDGDDFSLHVVGCCCLGLKDRIFWDGDWLWAVFA